MRYDSDYVMCECPIDSIKGFVEGLEKDHSIRVIKEPSVCLTMVRAEDSLEKQEFYLGEALTTECEVEVDGEPGYGLCLGEEPVRGYCIAVLDAMIQSDLEHPRVNDFIETQRSVVERNEKEEYARTLKTRVDFKLMEEDD